METILVKYFGKDHWSLLAYIETRCVDFDGVLDRRHLRCNNSHLLHSHIGGWDDKYSTRLNTLASKTRVMAIGHDDHDCLEDLENAGFIKIISNANLLVKMTELGLNISSKIRAHKASGGNFAKFELKL